LKDKEEEHDRDDPILDAGAHHEEDDVFGKSDDETNEPRQPNLHPQDPANFFKLSSFLKIVLAHTITDDDIDQAEGLIRAYCTELLHVSCFSLCIPILI
jgi:hypothetical protein